MLSNPQAKLADILTKLQPRRGYFSAFNNSMGAVYLIGGVLNVRRIDGTARTDDPIWLAIYVA